MQSLTVNCMQSKYEIHINNGIIADLDYFARRHLKGNKVVLISDKNVWRHHGEAIRSGFASSDYKVHRLLVKPGENSKHIRHITAMYQALVRLEVTRDDLIIAFGGGVVGDLTGFIASTYLRGIPLIQVPTTLLAMVDSSVGGKVAVNLDEGKNLVGSFYQPEAVLIDPDLLRTLPSKDFSSGMAEVLKYGCIRDAELFASALNLYQAQDIYRNVVPLIRRCCEIKAEIVERDVLDKGERMLLNFGHTIGHAIEQAMAYDGISHGEAVAIGMYRMAQLGEDRGWTRQGTSSEIVKAIKVAGLPLESPVPLRDAVIETVRKDKKRKGDQLNLIVLEEIGSARIHSLPVDEFESWFE